MKVAKLVASRQIEIFDEPKPVARNIGEVLLKVSTVGICGSDLHYFRHGGLGSFQEKLPKSLCHELSGTVIQSLSPDFKPLDRVAVEPGHPCGTCRMCIIGKSNLCERVSFIGANRDGALQEYIVVRDSQIVKSRILTDRELMMTEPLGVALHAWNRLSHKALESVAIIGVGAIGLLIGAVSKAMCADSIFVTDTLPYRVNFAQAYLGDIARDKLNQPTEKFDVVYDVAGTQDAIHSSMNLADAGGSVVLVGIPEDDYRQYNPHKCRIKELTVYNTRRSHDTLHKSVSLIENRYISVKSLVSHEFTLDEAQEAFELAADYKDNAIKTVISP